MKVVIALALLLSGCDAIHDLERMILFPAPATSRDPDSYSAPDGYERWWLDTAGGERVEAWYLPPAHEPAPAVIYAHGNAELISSCTDIASEYHDLGAAVLLPEYRGYGASGGRPGEDAIEADFAAFYDRLAARPEIDRARIAFHGRSLGGGVVGVLSARRRAAALVLESTFTSVPDVASQWFLPAHLMADRFDTHAAIAGSAMPILIVHGFFDELIPFKHARENQRAAPQAFIAGYRAGHNDLPHSQRYWATVEAFLRRAGVLRSR